MEATPKSTTELIQMVKAVRDEVTLAGFGGFTGSNREYAMTLTKLDEAELWLQRYAIQNGSLLLVDKARYAIALASTDNTDNTHGEEASGDV